MAVRIRFRHFYECDTEAERSLDFGIDSLIHCLDTGKYYKIYAGSYTEVPAEDVIFTSPIPISKLAISGVPDGTKYLRDDGTWDTPPGGGGGGASSVGTNDLNKSDGSGGFLQSYIFSASAGNLNLGTGQSGSLRAINADGSATDVSLRLSKKGNGQIWLDAGTNVQLSVTSNLSTSRVYANKPLSSSSSVTYPFAVWSGTYASTYSVGLGAGIEFLSDTSSTNTEIGAAINTVSTSLTSTAESFDFVIKTMTSGAAASEKLRIISTGQLRLNNYTSLSSFTGTVVGYLAFDSSGNIITSAGGGGGGPTGYEQHFLLIGA